MTSTEITSVVAAYASIVSTLSLILAIKVHHAANPRVSVDWIYSQPDKNLTVTILNTGRGDVTISTIDLYIVRHVIIRGSREGGQWDSRTDTISKIPSKLWVSKPKGFALPSRLIANSMLSVRVKNDAISLPSQFPPDELELKFVAGFPGGNVVAYLGGDVLRHCGGIDPDRAIAFSPGNVLLED